MPRLRVHPRNPSHRAANRRRERMTFQQVLSQANQRAHDRANRRLERRSMKTIRAAIAEMQPTMPEAPRGTGFRTVPGWLCGLAILPLCWITTWTFLNRFADAALHTGFWQTEAFWYFAVGVLAMIGWLSSGLLRNFFLYLYVFGHELTHAFFVVLSRDGRVKDIHVSASGGYVTTNKSGLLIALSPYMIPFWSVIWSIGFAVLQLASDPSPAWKLAFYVGMGASWAFHMIWTLWMLPKDQPDLHENGVFLSLTLIYLANIMMLVALFCLADANPWQASREFARDWFLVASEWGETAFTTCSRWLQNR